MEYLYGRRKNVQEQVKTDPLELINQRFLQIQTERLPEPKKKKASWKRILLLVFLLLVIAALGAGGFWYYIKEWPDRHSDTGAAGSARRASITGSYQGILTSQEVEEWNDTKVQRGKVYLKLRTQVPVSERRIANIRVVNPPYCAYNYRFTIAESETGEVLYESEVLKPGTVLEQVSLNRQIEHGQTEATVTYTFYQHGKEEAEGTKEIQVVLDTEK